MFRQALADSKYREIEKLLKQGINERQVRCILGVSNTPVRKVKMKLGIIPEKYNAQTKRDAGPEIFVCPGIQGCVTCKHIFQYGCPMATDSP